MIDFEKYRQNYGQRNSVGDIRKQHSDMIMEYTWDGDIQTKQCYLYDCYHDDELHKLRNLSSQNSTTKTPISAKYIVDSYQSMDKDQVSYHIQFKPSQECNVDYYAEMFEKRYDTLFPLGLYIDIPDAKGQYNKWLIVDKANYYNPQFITFQILPCDYIFQWIYENKKYQIAGVLRSQNSYNSGVWSDYRITFPEDQRKFIVPLNRDTEKLFYNQRMIIDAKVESEPVVWDVTKTHRLAPNGLLRATLAQGQFNHNTDYIERDNEGNIVGMWADYFPAANNTNEYATTLISDSKIIYSGKNPQIKINGSAKTFTLQNAEDKNINWSFKINSIPVSDDPDSPVRIVEKENNFVKLKFAGTFDYIGSILTVIAFDGNNSTSIDIEVIGM